MAVRTSFRPFGVSQFRGSTDKRLDATMIISMGMWTGVVPHGASQLRERQGPSTPCVLRSVAVRTFVTSVAVRNVSIHMVCLGSVAVRTSVLPRECRKCVAARTIVKHVVFLEIHDSANKFPADGIVLKINGYVDEGPSTWCISAL